MRDARRHFIILAVLILVAALSTACGDDSESATQGGSPSGPSGVQPGNASGLPQDIQKLQISVSGGRFGHDRYEMQQGAVQLVISAAGGPYTFAVDKLIAAQQLPADATTTIGVNVPNPGDYTMRLTDQAEATAVLHVRAPGGK